MKVFEHALPHLRFRTYCDLVMLQEGSETTNERLTRKYGITHFEKIDPSCSVYSIGFAPKDKKWWGWSHRAIFGFTIGSTCKLGDIHFVPANEEDFFNQTFLWYNDSLHKNLEIKKGFNDDKPGLWVSYNIRTNNGKELSTIKTFNPYPKEWGKGEWVAKTLEDAKQMAIDFSRSVS